jgi:mannosyltransferase OCH1-like enzyme
MIPKVIHYCWFGHGEKPKLIKKCIDSWYRVLPDYEIKEWNEDNWDVNKYKYTQQAYEQKKWAFCSDTCRMDILYREGGISFDADIEAIRSFPEEMLNQRAFTSKESSSRWISAVIAAEQGHPWIKKILRYYKQNDFEFNPTKITNTTIIDNINKRWYKETKGDIIYLHKDVVIYPADWLEANSWSTGMKNITPRTITCHHYTASWLK